MKRTLPASIEGALLGLLLGILPLPFPILPLAAVLFMAAARAASRRLPEAIGVLGGAVLVLAFLNTLPAKPLDERLELEADASVGEILDALDRSPRLAVRADPSIDRFQRLKLPANPRANQAVDALRSSAGLRVRTGACATGWSFLQGTDGAAVVVSR